MFTHLLPTTNNLLSVKYEDFAQRHFRSTFVKKYAPKWWNATERSIFYDLQRLRILGNNTQKTDQLDELKYYDCHWLAKYDFKVAGTKVSKKDSGNRCIIYIDDKLNQLSILMIYHKDNLPKNKSETQYIMDTVQKEYKEYWSKVIS